MGLNSIPSILYDFFFKIYTGIILLKDVTNQKVFSWDNFSLDSIRVNVN